MRCTSSSGTAIFTFTVLMLTSFTTGIPGAAACPTSAILAEMKPLKGAQSLVSESALRAMAS